VTSRLGYDENGRRIVVATSVAPGVTCGSRLGVVLGDSFVSGGRGVYFLAQERGRRPTAMERSTARPPYDPNHRRKREQVADDELDEPSAIQLARLEQETAPADLLNAA
jgi:hypothetical protein